MMQEATAETEYLSTAGNPNPLWLLESFGEEPIVLGVVAIWTRRTMTGNLEEKGRWVHSLWGDALLALPEAAGCRLSWNTLFFAAPHQSLAMLTKRFRELLQSHQDSCLTSFCVLCEVAGEPGHKLDVLDVLGHEVASAAGFGACREYRPDGHRFYHLQDGKPLSTK